MINQEANTSRSPVSAGTASGAGTAARLAPRKFQPMALPPLPEQPLFSVLIPNYNYGRYLGATLQSVLDQTYRNFEVIVCDDGSKDNSRDVVQEYARRDSRIRLVAKQNGGFASALNKAYENSQGKLIALLDADDGFKPRKLELALASLRNNPRSGFCVDRTQPVSAAGQPLGSPYPQYVDHGWIGPEKLRQGSLSSLPPTSGLSFRREVAEELFPIPLAIPRLIDCYLCSAQFLTEISVATECLTRYRLHDAHLSGRRESAGQGDDPKPFWAMFDAEVQIRFVGELEDVLSAQKAFLARLYGAQIADSLRLEDHQGYWDSLLGIRALRGKRAGAIRPYTVEEMIGHVSRPANKRMWRALMRLPDPLAKRAYRFWRGSSPLKRLAKAAVLPVIRR
ncbi:MAG TPA: glycosyltransferase family 2 protein [Terriglobia bacterium]|nr:glycosyltransferase family 2 protein [Terriglobia bacterium]